MITYLFDPPRTNPIFAFFAWYIFYLMGVTLETTWGLFRYNVYLAIGYFASLAFAFLCWFATGVPGQAATNGVSLRQRIPGLCPLVSRLRAAADVHPADQDQVARAAHLDRLRLDAGCRRQLVNAMPWCWRPC